jgi:hypothetical protein
VKKLLLILFTFYFFDSVAQEPLMPVLAEHDSVAIAAERQLMYYQLLSGTLQLGDFMEPVQLPDYNFQREMVKRWNSSVSDNPVNLWSFERLSPGFSGVQLSPFLRNETVFSGASYQVNERFTLGGYSFGANSVFSAPFPNQGINNFDFRGSTMFLKYNVSKNFKIETRISVTKAPGY